MIEAKYPKVLDRLGSTYKASEAFFVDQMGCYELWTLYSKTVDRMTFIAAPYDTIFYINLANPEEAHQLGQATCNFRYIVKQTWLLEEELAKEGRIIGPFESLRDYMFKLGINFAEGVWNNYLLRYNWEYFNKEGSRLPPEFPIHTRTTKVGV